MATKKKQPQERRHLCLECLASFTDSELDTLTPEDLDAPFLAEWVRTKKSETYPHGKCPVCGSPCWPHWGNDTEIPAKLCERESPTATTLLAYLCLDLYSLRERVYEAALSQGGRGITAFELPDLLVFPGGPTVQENESGRSSFNQRLSELVEEFRLRNTGQRRYNSKSKCWGDVWVACPKVERGQQDPRLTQLFAHVVEKRAELKAALKEKRRADMAVLAAHDSLYRATYTLYGEDHANEWRSEMDPRFKRPKAKQKRAGQ